jgi:hypothetical protein
MKNTRFALWGKNPATKAFERVQPVHNSFLQRCTLPGQISGRKRNDWGVSLAHYIQRAFPAFAAGVHNVVVARAG